VIDKPGYWKLIDNRPGDKYTIHGRKSLLQSLQNHRGPGHEARQNPTVHIIRGKMAHKLPKLKLLPRWLPLL
jgi:hypothetical protein